LQTWFLQPSRKSKKEKDEIIIPLEDLSPIAHPLAQRKLAKKLHKTIKKGLFVCARRRIVELMHFTASKARQVKRGVKEVVKGIRKGELGYVC
jgi:H/ACA ribonucleoprotein complex subunit 2